jgi:hypothetical protein
MIIIPEQEDASPGANGWSVREGSESKASDIRRSLLVNRLRPIHSVQIIERGNADKELLLSI